MFRTCVFCNRDLGDNESVENFPVGRRLAFDSEKGRLWVICQRCRRWNLSPLEERWEAIEECERRFHDTPTRFSTDNIGLAELPEGLQLVRIGEPQRREFAAWRYGREFWRRRVRTAASAAVQTALGVGAAVAGAQILPLLLAWRANRVVARTRDDQGQRLYISGRDALRVELIRDAGPEGWRLVVPHHRRERFLLLWSSVRGRRRIAELSGPRAMEAAGRILPRLNEWGGSDAQVRQAVELVEEARTPERLFARVAGEPRLRRIWGYDRVTTRLKRLGGETRLALEMSVHEEGERRALEGELALLEEAWREAEEIAAIADRLLIPESVEDWIRRQKRKLRVGG